MMRAHSPTPAGGQAAVAKHQINLPLFNASGPVGPHHVVFIENRPVKPFAYHDMIADAHNALQQLEGGQIPADLPAAFVEDHHVRQMVEAGLLQGKFRDTTKVAVWIDKMNSAPSRFAELEIPELQLTLAHAESHIDMLSGSITAGNHPAGVVLSGSPKMLSDCHATDPAVAKTIELAKYCLTNNIPILGICFGMHLLAYARFGEQALVQWLKNPPDMTLRVLPGEGGKKVVMDPVTAGLKQMVYGTCRINRANTHSNHPMLKFTNGAYGFEVHSQFLAPNQVPADTILATSVQRFRRDRMTKERDELVRTMVEVLQCGAVAFATQGHPELTAELLLAITYMPKYEKVLREEGHDLERARAQLSRQLHSGPKWGVGERFGYNFIKYVVLANYLKKLLANESAGTPRFDHLTWLFNELQRLNPRLNSVLV